MALGLVNRVVPAAELDAFVDDWAARLAAGPPIALSMTQAAARPVAVDVRSPQALEDEARPRPSTSAPATPSRP